jgi:hypothetical protein
MVEASNLGQIPLNRALLTIDGRRHYEVENQHLTYKF